MQHLTKKNLSLGMFTLEITTLDGQQTVELPSGWHEVSYSYYKDRIAPYAQPDQENAVKNNVNLVCSLLGINANEANIMEFSAILGNLLTWMEEIPEVKEFWHNDVMYEIPMLGKAQAGDKPFMSVGDWENANDAMKFLQDSKYDQDNNADVGLVLLCALARGPEDVTDVEFARRLEAWTDMTMDVILSATFFFLLFNHTFEKVTLHSLTELTKKATRLLPNITLDGLRWLHGSHPQVYLQSLLNKEVL
jgi:hypothetical protein